MQCLLWFRERKYATKCVEWLYDVFFDVCLFVCTVTASRLNKGTRIRTTVKTERVWVTHNSQFLNTKEMQRIACVCTMCCAWWMFGCLSVNVGSASFQLFFYLFIFFKKAGFVDGCVTDTEQERKHFERERILRNKLIMKLLVPVVTGWVDVEPIKSWYTHAHVIAVNVNININVPLLTLFVAAPEAGVVC